MSRAAGRPWASRVRDTCADGRRVPGDEHRGGPRPERPRRLLRGSVAARDAVPSVDVDAAAEVYQKHSPVAGCKGDADFLGRCEAPLGGAGGPRRWPGDARQPRGRRGPRRPVTALPASGTGSAASARRQLLPRRLPCSLLLWRGASARPSLGTPRGRHCGEGAEGEPGRRSGPRAGRSGARRGRLPRRSTGRARRPQAPWAVSVRLTFRLPSLEQSPPGGTKGIRRTRLPTGEEMRSGDGNQPGAAPTPPPSAGARAFGARAFAVGGPGGCPGWPRPSGATRGRGRGAGA